MLALRSAPPSLVPLGIYDPALFVHHIVIINQVLADVEVVALNTGLGAVYGTIDYAVFDGLVFFR